MSDAVERVARRLTDAPKDELSNDWMVATAKAERAIAEYTAWLTEQGVPVDQLLSGEMVAVPKEPTPEILEHAYHGPVISWHRMIEAHQQVQLDHAGPEEKG